MRTDDIRDYIKSGWTNPACINGLKDDGDINGFDLEDIVNSATWFQDEFGGFGKQPSPSDLVNYADGGWEGPLKDLWINLHVVDYDKMHPVGRDTLTYYGEFKVAKGQQNIFLNTCYWNPRILTTIQSHVLNNCAYHIKHASSWHYKGMNW